MNTNTRKAPDVAASKAHMEMEGFDFSNGCYAQLILVAIELAGLVMAYAAVDLGHHAAAIGLCTLVASALRVVEPRLAGMAQAHGGRKKTGTTLVSGTRILLGRRRAARLRRPSVRTIELGKVD